MNQRKHLPSLGLLLLIILHSFPVSARQTAKEVLQGRISQLIKASNAAIGVAVAGLDFQDSLLVKTRDSFPMQSVYKFPLAIAVLHLADMGRLSLDRKIHIHRQQMDTATWSPMLKKFHGDMDLTVRELLNFSVAYSDNNACDILFRMAGGPKKVSSYMRSTGISGMALAATEAQMKTGWQVQYTNWCRPEAMVQLLRQFYTGKLLSPANTALLLQQMTQSSNSDKRIKGQLPSGTEVAHKTGTSDTNAQGITAATNDIGIVTLPNGKHIALVVYVSDYKGGVVQGEQLIAQISKLVWDYYSNN